MDTSQFALHLQDGVPTVTLEDARVSGPQGWSVLNRAALIVVDGPGNEGFLLSRMSDGAADAAPVGWDAAVVGRGAVQVVTPGVCFEAALVD